MMRVELPLSHFLIALPILLATMRAPYAEAIEAPEIIENSIGMKLALIPAGEFQMGAEEDRNDTLNYFRYCDPKRLDGELPRHKVKITKPFYMGQHEVTLGQFFAFYHAAKYKTDAERDGKPSWGYKNGKLVESNEFTFWKPGWELPKDHPVVYVSWNDAVVFCAWLSKKEAKKYRLPTEAEWEYACRAGSSTRYHFGNDPEDLVRFANAADQDSKDPSIHSPTALYVDGKRTTTKIPFPYLSRRDGYKWTAPVGKFRPNDFGMYDMHGNVWEWCSDWFDEEYYANSPTENPQGPTTGSLHVARGGGFIYPPVDLRCAFRVTVESSYRNSNYGFRVVCER